MVKDNQNNPIFIPGTQFVDYKILNKTIEGDNATIVAYILTKVPGKTNDTTAIPIYYKFILFYEDNEWKVWTVSIYLISSNDQVLVRKQAGAGS